MTEGQATERFKPYKFVLLRENLNHAQFSKKFKKGTITQYLFANNLIDECISWLKVRRTPSPRYRYLFANNLIDECISWLKVSSVSDPYSLNPDPDPAKNLHPDPEDP